MKKILLPLIIFSCINLLPASTKLCKTMKEAQTLAGGSADIVILHHGSGWNETGKYLKSVWTSSAFKKASRRIVQLEDLPTSVNELSNADREKLQKESERTGKGMDRLIGEFLNKGKTEQYKTIKNYPALSLYDSKGNYVASVEGLTKMSPTKLAAEVASLQKVREKRDSYLKKSENAVGQTKIHLLAKAIRCVAPYLPADPKQRRRSKYLEYLYQKSDQLKKLDPNDKLGYQRALEMEPFSFIYKNKSYFDFDTKKIKNKSVLQDCLKKIDRELRDPRNRVLLPSQLQALYVVKYNIVKHLDQKLAEKVCLKGAKIDPNSVFGQGLSGKYLLDHGPATVRHGWKARHSKENKWRFGTDPVLETLDYYIDKPGIYELTFVPQNGSISVQSISLKSRGKPITSVSKIQNARAGETVSFKLPVKRLARNMVLEVSLGNAVSGNGKIYSSPGLCQLFKVIV